MSKYKLDYRTQKARDPRHEVNEDSYFFTKYTFMNDHDVSVLCVADGMGGYEQGDQASKHAVEGFVRTFYGRMVDLYMNQDKKNFSVSHHADRIKDIIKAAFIDANQWVCEEAEVFIKTGTTLSVVVIIDDLGIIANVGDSPVYYYDSGENKLRMVAELHTQAELEAKQGLYDYYSKEYYSNDHRIYRNLGRNEELDINDIYVDEIGYLKTGDAFLIGSDGAFGRLFEAEIQEMLEEGPKYCLSQLFQLAGMDKDDDMTAILYIVE